MTKLDSGAIVFDNVTWSNPGMRQSIGRIKRLPYRPAIVRIGRYYTRADLIKYPTMPRRFLRRSRRDAKRYFMKPVILYLSTQDTGLESMWERYKGLTNFQIAAAFRIPKELQ